MITIYYLLRSVKKSVADAGIRLAQQILYIC